jgi:Ser/Thr protein kinase RdoA (MazF antagonist)
MNNLIALYQQRLDLQNASFSLVTHDDATVAIVYKITQHTDPQFILKICPRAHDYQNELYFLNYFADTLPVPRIVQTVEPEASVHGAILMEYLPGALLKTENLTSALAYEIGSALARIHLNRVADYGDITQPQTLTPDPQVYFGMKFEEGLSECSNHLPQSLLKKCRTYYDTHLSLFDSVGGPCITHRDFRPGNIIVNDGKLQGIIDWSSARASFAQEDFCFLEHGDWPMDSTNKQSFLSGYASIRPVPDYGAIMPLLRISRAIAIIGFSVKRGIWKTSMTPQYQFNRSFLEALFQES